MPILTQDIKLLKSAVMADTSDGGGQMTGTEVIDGQSNNLFPDTSAMDRAFGRVNMRKVFGVAHTTDTATLLGAHAVITDAPDDPLVHCTLIKTTGWSDDRSAAKSAVEKYLVKGPKAQVRIYDTHYAGSMQLRLICIGSSGSFPAGGDAIVLRNPDGLEQYVRVIKIVTSYQSVSLLESNMVVSVGATVGTCDLGQSLTMDVLGPPAARVFNANGIGAESLYAMLYTTSLAAGARFYGVKPLGVPALAGDISATTSGGIYTPVVPAATVETPIIDQYPLTSRSATVASAIAVLGLPAVVHVLSPNATVTLPTAIEARSLTIAHGSTSFTDNGEALYQGAVKVGAINYRTGVITLAPDSASYGSALMTVSYKPAAAVSAMGHSRSFAITQVNQGLAFVDVIEPLPAPGSVSLSYMAQGRWYDIGDNGNGKLASDGYGSGTINYASGSLAVTLAAIPDVGSSMIFLWGDKSAAVAPTSYPAKVWADLPLSRAKAGGISVAWSNGAANFTATSDASGLLSGDASGQFMSGVLRFAPNVFPSGDVVVDYFDHASEGDAFTTTGSFTHTLTAGLPVKQGSFTGTALVAFPANALYIDSAMDLIDIAGVIYAYYGARSDANRYAVGTINYGTGELVFMPSFTISGTTITQLTATPANGPAYSYWRSQVAPMSISHQSASGFQYAYGSESGAQVTISAPAWTAIVPTEGRVLLSKSLAFKLGSEVYTAAGAVLQKGWNAATGQASVASAGSTAVNGQINITSLPANGVNAITWSNAALDSNSHLIQSGVFRTASAPLKTGVFQLQQFANVGTGNDAGVLSGGGFTGELDYQRGLVTWRRGSTDPEALSYNAVFLQYMPLDASLLGIETARLPLDGKVPIYRSGDLVVVHNTLTFNLPNPLVKTTVYDLGRERLASVRVKDATGVVVPDTLYTAALDPGTFMVPSASVITAYPQPWTVEHRIEDMLLCSVADISGKLTFTRSLTHNFPDATSFVSSAMPFGDLFARVYSLFEQGTWTSVWQDTLIGTPILAQFNTAQYPILVTNAGAIKERWLILFTNSGSFRVIGESVGEIGTGSTSHTVNEPQYTAPLNPATLAPYFTIPDLGWGTSGGGWSSGNCLRFNTDACGTPFWAVRTVLQGPASIDSDQFTLAFRGDVDRVLP